MAVLKELCYNFIVRDLLRILAIGIIIFISPYVYAEQHKVLGIPDNIVTENLAIDAFIFNAPAEFFAGEVANILNQTDYIKVPTISEERSLLKSNPYTMVSAKNLTGRFRNTYTVDYISLKKIADKAQARYALLITSAIDSENYILRRTFWDFLNIPGASVVDPAYKISTYAVLVDTKNNTVLWSNTFYKTISVVENRIITRGPSPQTEQLQKIRDYSRMLCPEIAQNVQLKVLPPDTYAKETNQIYYDMGNFDNVFTKKYRRWHKEGGKDYAVAKSRVDAKIADTKDKINETKENAKSKWQQYQEDKARQKEEKALKKLQETEKLESKLEVKAEPADKIQPAQDEGIHNINFKKPSLEDQSLYEPIDIQKTKKNNLYGEFDSSRPPLRDYN